MHDQHVDKTLLQPNVPNAARIWNYWLSGKDNLAADRAIGDQVRTIFPGIVDLAREHRLFLGRAVRYLVEEAGIRQFLDIGMGLPAEDNTHEVAQRLAPESRVVYVDNDPLVLVHARALLTSYPEGTTDYIEADLRQPDEILASAARTLDLTRPVAFMLLGVLHFVWDDDEVQQIIDRLLKAVPSGSHVAVAHTTTAISGGLAAKAVRVWNETARPKLKSRSPKRIAEFFDGLEMVEPGWVSSSRWRPDLDPFGLPAEVDQWAGVARKP
ncbi:SAM-dependent methyltransferase [Nonomuraea sp. M3C6]|uniref:SAM-dependent methyltransferase n=1 Tax=Nonomuraea marmarensis TaxID=3351344 RepID=A0ABW7AZ62_9ACTN